MVSSLAEPGGEGGRGLPPVPGHPLQELWDWQAGTGGAVGVRVAGTGVGPGEQSAASGPLVPPALAGALLLAAKQDLRGPASPAAPTAGRTTAPASPREQTEPCLTRADSKNIYK